VGSGANNIAHALAVQPDGKIVMGGQFTTVSGVGRNFIARLNADGTLDNLFTPLLGGPDGPVRAVAVQPDGEILIAGEFLNYDGASRNGVARLLANGALDSSFVPGTGADATVLSVAVQADGNVLVGGDVANFNGVARSRIARLVGSSGGLDGSFLNGQ